MAILLESGSYLLREDGGKLLTEDDASGWPPDVNLWALYGTNSEAPDANVIEFVPEVGPPITRRRMSVSSDTVSFTTWMTAAEYASFLFFYRTTLKDGTLPFTRTRPRTGAVETFYFSGDAPTVKAVTYSLYEVPMTMKSAPA
jgi:hypothetical protein